MALIIINQLIYPYASQWDIFLLSFGGTCVYYLWENLSTWSLIVTSLFRVTSLAVKWETLCSFPFSHLQTFSFPSLSSNFLVHKHADDDWWCLLGYLDEGFVCVLDTVLLAYMSQCVSGTWSDLTWKKQIRGCVYNPIAIFPAWNSSFRTTCYLLIKISQMGKWGLCSGSGSFSQPMKAGVGFGTCGHIHSFFGFQRQCGEWGR